MPFRSRATRQTIAEQDSAVAVGVPSPVSTPTLVDRQTAGVPPDAGSGVQGHPAGAEGGTPAGLAELLPGAPLRDVVLASCGSLFTWEDVVDWMRDDGTWAAAARHAAEGMNYAADGVAAPSAVQLRAEAQRFRRARHLVAGEDILRWLAHWAISEEEWVDWLDRSLRREAAAVPPRCTLVVDDQATWVEAVCSGDLEEAAVGLGRALGAWAERTSGAPPPELDRFAALRRAADEFAQAPVPRAEIERTIGGNAAGWVQVALDWADFGSSDAAREAIASVRDDGIALGAVAELARVGVEDAVARADDLDARTRAVALSAPLDSPVLVGTPEEPGIVAVVRARRHPSADDPDDQTLATEFCIEERVQAAADRWVTWRA